MCVLSFSSRIMYDLYCSFMLYVSFFLVCCIFIFLCCYLVYVDVFIVVYNISCCRHSGYAMIVPYHNVA